MEDRTNTSALIEQYRDKTRPELCTTRRGGKARYACRCGPCTHCGYGPHMGIHQMNTDGKMVGHRYEEM